jgi:hypothetical protein
VLNINQDFRQFILVTSDGFPYKVKVVLIKNEHTCPVCGYKLIYFLDMNETSLWMYFTLHWPFSLCPDHAYIAILTARLGWPYYDTEINILFLFEF